MSRPDLVICQRYGDNNKYHICLKRNPKIWDWGFNVQEAIDRIVATCPKLFLNGIGQIFDRGLVAQDLLDIKNED